MDAAQTVSRAMAILETLGEHKALSAARINEILGYHRSTLYRLLSTLQQLKYVRKDPESGFYTLSPRILRLASSVMVQQDIGSVAKPFMEALHEKTQETLHLAVLDDGELIYLGKMESTKNLRVAMNSREGQHGPLYCTGIGKVLLAWMEEDDFSSYVKKTSFVKYTESTLTNGQALQKEREHIRNDGYGLDREEHEEGVFCVAAPIKDYFDRVVAALSVSLPSVRLNDELKEQLITDVKETAQKISKVLV